MAARSARREVTSLRSQSCNVCAGRPVSQAAALRRRVTSASPPRALARMIGVASVARARCVEWRNACQRSVSRETAAFPAPHSANDGALVRDRRDLRYRGHALTVGDGFHVKQPVAGIVAGLPGIVAARSTRSFIRRCSAWRRCAGRRAPRRRVPRCGTFHVEHPPPRAVAGRDAARGVTEARVSFPGTRPTPLRRARGFPSPRAACVLEDGRRSGRRWRRTHGQRR